MQNQIRCRKKVRQWFVLPSDNIFSNALAILDTISLFHQMLYCTCQEASRTAGRIQNDFTQFRVNHFRNKLSNGSWGIEFPTLSCALQLLQYSFVKFTKCMAILCFV